MEFSLMALEFLGKGLEAGLFFSGKLHRHVSRPRFLLSGLGDLLARQGIKKSESHRSRKGCKSAGWGLVSGEKRALSDCVICNSCYNGPKFSPGWGSSGKIYFKNRLRIAKNTGAYFPGYPGCRLSAGQCPVFSRAGHAFNGGNPDPCPVRGADQPGRHAGDCRRPAAVGQGAAAVQQNGAVLSRGGHLPGVHPRACPLF